MWILIGASLSEPHIDYDNGPHVQNNGMSVSIYVSMSVSFTPRSSHPAGSRDPCSPWNTLYISVYWRAHMRDLQLHSMEQQELWTYSLPAVRIQ